MKAGLKRNRSSHSKIDNGGKRKLRNRTIDAGSGGDSYREPGQLNVVFDLIEARANDPALENQPSILYPSHGTEYVAYTARDIHRLSSKAAEYYNDVVPQRTSSDEEPTVVALLAPSTFDYLIAALGLSRLGHTVLLLSTRISEDAHVSLIERCNAKYLLVNDSFLSMAYKIAGHFSHLVVGRIVSQAAVTACDKQRDIARKLDPSKERNNTAWIVHSSGSTSLPKPNYYSHAASLDNFQSQFRMVGFVTWPLFHMQGLGSVFRSITNKKPIYMWNAHLPLTNQHLTKVLREHPDIQILYCVPYAMKLLADTEQGIALSRRLEVLLCGGGACPKPVGDSLSREGVYVVSHLGSTETGQLMNSDRPRDDILEWDWLRPSEKLQKYLRWEPCETGNNLYEMVVLEGWPSKVAANRDDGAYATKDLWERHPDYPSKNAWRYYARKDDTIVLSNGEKANPILFEDAARESPFVADAIVFGAQKSQLGMFVLVSEDSTIPEHLVDVIWPSIQRANVVAPGHAQMAKEMIHVLVPEQAHRVRKTDKSTIIRPAFYKEFAELIDAAYDQPVCAESLVLDKAGLTEFLAKEIKALVEKERWGLLGDDVDLFSMGMDSLQASRLRGAILRHVRISGKELPENFVFENPSINAMAAALLGATGTTEASVSVAEKMERLVQKFSKDFPTHTQSSSENGEHVVVTGATGSLGAHIVAQLASKAEVQRIYCLVRARSDEEALQRVRHSLRLRGLEVDEQCLEAFAADFSMDHLGLSNANYSDLTQNITSVIHSAWNVNFNLGLESFEADCLRGTRSLIDLCLRSRGLHPATFVFCSSISTVADTPGAEIAEEPCTSLHFAQNMGYAQSKLVAENVCLNASKESGIVCRALRIGQIVGDTQSGIWNRQEAVPLIFQSAEAIKALPDLDEDCSWLPVDVVAGCVIDVKDNAVKHATDARRFDVNNIVNPHTFHWTRELLPMLKRAGIYFETVSAKEWLRLLREHPDPQRNPCYKLIDFFASKYDADITKRSFRFRSEKGREASAVLEKCGGLDQNLLNKFVAHILRK